MTRETFRIAALHFMNIPYRWGGASPLEGIDCSELAQECLRMMGIDPPGDQTADDLWRYFREPSRGKIGQLDTGSLCFYRSGGAGKMTHVAIMIDPPTIIEAGGGGSKTTSLESAISTDARVRVRPYTHRSDLIEVIRPNLLPWSQL